jgi:small subunit ribosomal protein S14
MTRHDQWKLLDNFRRKSFVKTELRRMMLRSITQSKTTPLSQRYVAQFGLSHLPRQASRNKIQNRCVVSGRNWNVMRKTQYSRFVFRQKAYFSFLPAVRRASW